MDLQDILSYDTIDEETELSNNEIQEALNFLNNDLPSITDDIYMVGEEATLSLLSEGQNIDITKSLFKTKKAYKKYIKAAKKCIKAGDSSGAKQNLKDAKKCISEFEADIKKFDTTNVGSQVLGLLFGGIVYLLNNLKTLLPFFGISMAANGKIAYDTAKAGIKAAKGEISYDDATKIATKAIKPNTIILSVTGIVEQIKCIIDLVKRLQANIDMAKEKGETMNISIINRTYNECCKSLKEMRATIDKMIASIK